MGTRMQEDYWDHPIIHDQTGEGYELTGGPSGTYVHKSFPGGQIFGKPWPLHSICATGATWSPISGVWNLWYDGWAEYVDEPLKISPHPNSCYDEVNFIIDGDLYSFPETTVSAYDLNCPSGQGYYWYVSHSGTLDFDCRSEGFTGTPDEAAWVLANGTWPDRDDLTWGGAPPAFHAVLPDQPEQPWWTSSYKFQVGPGTYQANTGMCQDYQCSEAYNGTFLVNRYNANLLDERPPSTTTPFGHTYAFPFLSGCQPSGTVGYCNNEYLNDLVLTPTMSYSPGGRSDVHGLKIYTANISQSAHIPYGGNLGYYNYLSYRKTVSVFEGFVGASNLSYNEATETLTYGTTYRVWDQLDDLTLSGTYAFPPGSLSGAGPDGLNLYVTSSGTVGFSAAAVDRDRAIAHVISPYPHRGTSNFVEVFDKTYHWQAGTDGFLHYSPPALSGIDNQQFVVYNSDLEKMIEDDVVYSFAASGSSTEMPMLLGDDGIYNIRYDDTMTNLEHVHESANKTSHRIGTVTVSDAPSLTLPSEDGVHPPVYEDGVGYPDTFFGTDEVDFEYISQDVQKGVCSRIRVYPSGDIQLGSGGTKPRENIGYYIRGVGYQTVDEKYFEPNTAQGVPDSGTFYMWTGDRLPVVSYYWDGSSIALTNAMEASSGNRYGVRNNDVLDTSIDYRTFSVKPEGRTYNYWYDNILYTKSEPMTDTIGDLGDFHWEEGGDLTASAHGNNRYYFLENENLVSETGSYNQVRDAFGSDNVFIGSVWPIYGYTLAPEAYVYDDEEDEYLWSEAIYTDFKIQDTRLGHFDDWSNLVLYDNTCRPFFVDYVSYHYWVYEQPMCTYYNSTLSITPIWT
jgi:hypothetical protein